MSEVPLVGRPNFYSEAIGRKFEVYARATRTELYVGESLTYTVRVQAVGPHVQPPHRPRLDEIPRFQERFKIDTRPAARPDRTLSDQRAWEFDYTLRPLHDTVKRIPPLPLVWYRPHSDSKQRGFFFTTFADEIELKVKSVVVTPAVKQKPLVAPAYLFELASGSAVVEPGGPFTYPSVGLAVLLVLGPLGLAGTWYLLWRRLYPDAARLARIRQSRAAMEAFRSLARVGSLPEPARVERVTAIAATYLRQRFDLRAAEPTPGEAEEHLVRLGARAELAELAAGFFRTCDEVRFGPAGLAGPSARPDEELAASARRLIVALETEPWSRRA